MCKKPSILQIRQEKDNITVKKRSGGLGLSIWGGTRPSTTGVFNTVPLTVRVESAPSTPHKTNWDYTLASASTIDAVSSTGMLVYGITDYSSNKYDYYYATNKGKTPNLYDFEIDWYSNDVDMVDDIATVATKEWTSTEKYTYELANTSLTVDAIFNTTVSCTDLGSESNCNLPMYNYEATVETGVTVGPTGNAEGILTITYQDECGITRTATIVVSNNDDTVHQYQSTICSSSLPTISYSGTGTLYFLFYTAIVPAEACSPEIPSIGCEAGKYGLSSNFGKTKKCCSNGFTAYSTDNNQYTTAVLTTTMNIKLFNDELQNPNFLQPPRANYAPCPIGTFSTNPEYPDYSDIFIEIKYQTADISGTKVSETQVYSYGGILTRDEYIAKAVLISPKTSNTGFPGQGPGGPPAQTIPFSDDDGFKWYIVVRENTGEYLFTTLSTYMRPSTVLTSSSATDLYSDDPLTEPIFRKLYNTPSDNGSLLSISSNGTYLITNNTISLQANIKVIKIANFPSCGKVDIYKKKTGGITSYTGKTITSAGHGLVNGDLVKFSSAISISGVTNINGVRYASGVTANTFDIYYDNGFKSGVPIQNLYTVTGVNWSSNGWAYAHSLYSPMGKNGYGFTPQVRTVVETGVVEGSIYTRAIESSKKEGNLTRPQAYLNSWTSWSNFFPFKRIGPTARSNSVIYESYGGTRFGSDCQINKVSDNNYILMVTEPGAELSFQIMDEYYNNSDIPANKYVIPHYLPYGRIHFYNITKSPYAITYLTSVSQSDNPFAYYEALNVASKREGYNFITNNYDLTTDNSGVRTYLANNNIANLNPSEYWLGAQYYSWNRTYLANSTIGIDMPDQKAFPYEYGFLDSFGTSAAFDVESGILHCVASTYVKSADFYSIEKSRVQYVDALSEAFSINLATSVVSSLSGIPVRSDYITRDHNLQNAEIELYGTNTDFDNKQLFMGWMSANRIPESIYVYDRIGSGYNLKQTINNNANARGFGNYFVADNGFLVTNANSPVDNQGNFTESTNYLYLYTQDRKNDVYNFTQKISPTIDLDNSIYLGVDVRNYVPTANISYDNTKANSVTSKVNLDGKYDIYANSLVLRDYNEYAYFTYDASSGVFVCRNHHLITNNNLLTQLATLRMRPSAASFIEDNATAEHIESLEVLEASEDLKTIKIINQSYPNPTFLPLFIKCLDGDTGAMLLYANGHTPHNSGLTLITEAEAVHATGINLFAKQIEVHNSGLQLFIKQPNVNDSGIKLFIQQNMSEQNLNLVMPQKNYIEIPLVIKPYDLVLIDQSGNPIEIPSGELGNYIVPYDRGLTMAIESYHTGVPNASGAGFLFVKTDEYDDYSVRMNMLMVGDPLPSTNSSAQNLLIFSPSGSTPNYLTDITNSTLYLEGPDFVTGYPNDGAMALTMFRTPEAQLPLFVYNTYTSGNLNMLIQSANLYNSGLILYTSGEAFPVSYSDLTTLYLRGN
jgi:hypothetical protein